MKSIGLFLQMKWILFGGKWERIANDLYNFIHFDIFAYFHLHKAFMIIFSITYMPVCEEPACIQHDALSVHDSYCMNI